MKTVGVGAGHSSALDSSQFRVLKLSPRTIIYNITATAQDFWRNFVIGHFVKPKNLSSIGVRHMDFGRVRYWITF